MLLVCCGVVWILSSDVHYSKLTGRAFREKYKVTGIAYKTHRKIQGIVEISSAPYDAQGEWKDVLYHK